MCLTFASLSRQGSITPQFMGWLSTRSGRDFNHFVRFDARHLLYSSPPLISMSTALDRHASDSSDRLFIDHTYRRIHICRPEAQFCFRCFSSDKMYILNGFTTRTSYFAKLFRSDTARHSRDAPLRPTQLFESSIRFTSDVCTPQWFLNKGQLLRILECPRRSEATAYLVKINEQLNKSQ
jgi:hypothetical protein